MEHEYSKDDFCKNCGLQKSEIEKFSFNCTGQFIDQITSHREAQEVPNVQVNLQTPIVQSTEASDSDGLFSDGLLGLLNKGPVGWIVFGFIAGILYGAFNALQDWLK